MSVMRSFLLVCLLDKVLSGGGAPPIVVGQPVSQVEFLEQSQHRGNASSKYTALNMSRRCPEAKIIL